MVALRTTVLGDGDPFHGNVFGETRVMVMVGVSDVVERGEGV